MILWLAAASCAESFTGPALQVPQTLRTQDVAAERSAASVELATPALSPDLEHALIVGNGERLELWAIDGSTQRTLSEGAAFHPRKLNAETVLALRPSGEKPELGQQLVRISLRDGSRTVVANLPAFRCGNAAADAWQDLDIEDPRDFTFDVGGKVACFDLLDRNINMADVMLKVRVELDSGSVRRWLALGEPECVAPSGVMDGDPSDEEWCNPARESDDAPEPVASFAFDYNDETGWIERTGAAPSNYIQLPDYMREKLSPSGRWLVLGGDIQEADYIHRSLLLFDRETGSLYPVMAEPTAWPAPLTAAKPGAAVKAPSEGMADVVGESDVRWLSVSSGSELLIVDQLVIVPFRASWAFEGELAR